MSQAGGTAGSWVVPRSRLRASASPGSPLRAPSACLRDTSVGCSSRSVATGLGLVPCLKSAHGCKLRNVATAPSPKRVRVIGHDSSLKLRVGKRSLRTTVPKEVIRQQSRRIAHTKSPEWSAPHTSLAQGARRASVLCDAGVGREVEVPGPTRAKMIIARGLIKAHIFRLLRVRIKLVCHCPQQSPALRLVRVK